MKLNLGCGFKKKEGFINVDSVADCRPDMVVDLEAIPWPWADNSIDEIQLIHVLEHLGQRPSVYLGIIKEMYRVCRHDAKILIEVPHHRNDDFYSDPTHVRPITLKGLSMFNREINETWIAQGDAATPLAIYNNVDFHIANCEYIVNQDVVKSIYPNGATTAQMHDLIVTHANVAIAVRFEWIVRKRQA